MDEIGAQPGGQPSDPGHLAGLDALDQGLGSHHEVDPDRQRLDGVVPGDAVHERVGADLSPVRSSPAARAAAAASSSTERTAARCSTDTIAVTRPVPSSS